MASTIDRRHPLRSDATAQYEIRQNFIRAANDIEALQSGVITEPIYQDYLVPGLSAARVGASAPTVEAFKTWMRLPRFDNGVTVVEAWFVMHILHDIAQGTSPTLHVHWAHENATPTGDVKWSVDYQVAAGYAIAAFSDTPTTLSTVQTAGADGAHMITDDDDMVVTYSANLQPDSYLFGRIYRDPTDAEDTFADHVFLIGVDMHYQVGQLGTLERNAPFTGW